MGAHRFGQRRPPPGAARPARRSARRARGRHDPDLRAAAPGGSRIARTGGEQLKRAMATAVAVAATLVAAAPASAAQEQTFTLRPDLARPLRGRPETRARRESRSRPSTASSRAWRSTSSTRSGTEGLAVPRDAAPHRVPQPRPARQVRPAPRLDLQRLHCRSTADSRCRRSPTVSMRRERSATRCCCPTATAIQVKGNDDWVLLWMLMNHHAADDQVYIEYKITYETERQLAPAYMVWLDIENCLSGPGLRRPRRRRRRLDRTRAR